MLKKRFKHPHQKRLQVDPKNLERFKSRKRGNVSPTPSPKNFTKRKTVTERLKGVLPWRKPNSSTNKVNII